MMIDSVHTFLLITCVPLVSNSLFGSEREPGLKRLKLNMIATVNVEGLANCCTSLFLVFL